MEWRRAMTGLGCAVSAVALVACATPGYDASKVQRELVRAGATTKQAQCVTDGLTDKYAIKQLASHSAPSTAELEFTRALLKKCEIKLPLQPS